MLAMRGHGQGDSSGTAETGKQQKLLVPTNPRRPKIKVTKLLKQTVGRSPSLIIL